MSDNSLTITIPTYNRNAILKANLQVLLPQTINLCNIIVIDNHSDVSVEETLREELNEYPNLKVVRNKANVGLSGNLIKCFEICKTEWVWLIGDDDKTLPDAVNTVCEYTAKYPDAHYINFTSDLVNRNPKLVRQTDTEAVGADEFIEKIDDFSNVVFLSVGIYKTSQVRNYIRFAYLFSYTLAPHTALLLASLNEKSKIIFSSKEIISRYIVGSDDGENTWSQLFIRLSIPTLYEIPVKLNKINQDKFNFLIRNGIGRPIRILSEIIMYLNKKEKQELFFLYNQICHRMIPFGVSAFWRVEFYLGKIILYIPPLANFFARLNENIRKKKGKVITNADMFNRI